MSTKVRIMPSVKTAQRLLQNLKQARDLINKHTPKIEWKSAWYEESEKSKKARKPYRDSIAFLNRLIHTQVEVVNTRKGGKKFASMEGERDE